MEPQNPEEKVVYVSGEEAIDVDLLGDPLVELEAARWARRRWMTIGGLCLAALLGLGVVSWLQYSGAWMTYQVLEDAKKESAGRREEVTVLIEENRKLREQLEGALRKADRAHQRTDEVLRKWAVYQKEYLEALARDADMAQQRDTLYETLRGEIVEGIKRIRVETNRELGLLREEADAEKAMFAEIIRKQLEEAGKPREIAPCPHTGPVENPFVVPEPSRAKKR